MEKYEAKVTPKELALLVREAQQGSLSSMEKSLEYSREYAFNIIKIFSNKIERLRKKLDARGITGERI
jgi:hypothetical protein